MLSVYGRRPASVVVEPVARTFLRAGLTANLVTIIGTTATVLFSVILIPAGHLVAAAALALLFAAFDMVDGTMARLSGGGTAYGATLDASCDRITDGALFGAIAMWLIYVDHAPPATVAAALIVLVLSQVTSYVKARGEAGGLRIVGGLVERPERLIISLVSLALEGFGVPWALEVGLWLLAWGSAFTVVQRLHFAARDERAHAPLPPPAGAERN
ncbi:phosphatidylinositol phosphate synthase [Corynebacterium mayonis]|uniref:phosphatidylinositol phosphate synthase n=1 Tax=Corynebacterium mayonis TaxID=3062461 RepID=UPI003140B66F